MALTLEQAKAQLADLMLSKTDFNDKGIIPLAKAIADRYRAMLPSPTRTAGLIAYNKLILDGVNIYSAAITQAITETEALIKALEPVEPPEEPPVLEGFSIGQTSYPTLQAAFDAATPGTTVTVSGTVQGPAACGYMRVPGVKLRGIDCTVLAQGASAGGKAVIVVQAENFTVEDVDASGMQVEGKNGSFIRQEANGNLTLRRCRIHDGQQGVLTNNDLDKCHVLLEDCDFYRLGAGDGQSHNIYIGTIAELHILRGRYDDANIGHCIKSRAARTIIDGAQIHEGRASRAIDVPNGGFVEIGNCDIVQSQATNNSGVVSYGDSGKIWPINEFHFYASNKVTNTRVPAGAVFAFAFEPDKKVIEAFETGVSPPVFTKQPNPVPVIFTEGIAGKKVVNFEVDRGTVTLVGEVPPGITVELTPTSATYTYDGLAAPASVNIEYEAE
jgi:hypothetical protein